MKCVFDLKCTVARNLTLILKREGGGRRGFRMRNTGIPVAVGKTNTIL